MISSRGRMQQNKVFSSWKPGVKTISAIAIVILAIFSLYKLREICSFPIKEVKVYGIQHIARDEVQQLLVPLVKKSFFAVEVDEIKDRLMQMPWVADASVRRIWPDQVAIMVSEHDPIARWNDGSLLSATGEIFSPQASSYPDGLPQFVGPEGEQIHMLQYYKKINSLLVPLHSKISRFELTPYSAWNLTFDNGVKVNVGYKDVLTRIGHFVKVYPKIVGGRAADVDYVDLRYPNGLAVRWKTIT